MQDNEATFRAAVLGKTLMDCAAQRIFPAMRTLVAIPLWKKRIFLQHLEDLMICGSHFFRHCPLPLGTIHPLARWKQHKWTTYVFDLLMLSSRPLLQDTQFPTLWLHTWVEPLRHGSIDFPEDGTQCLSSRKSCGDRNQTYVELMPGCPDQKRRTREPNWEAFRQ